MILATIKSSKQELDRKEKDYVSKCKAVDDVKLSIAKAQASGKTKGISKLESKEDKAMNALAVATECYEYQLKLTNERIFESFNEGLPEQLQVRRTQSFGVFVDCAMLEI